jgi:hypothetical protein
MSDTHGKGQVAQAARWPATLKASGCLCLLDGGENGKKRIKRRFSGKTPFYSLVDDVLSCDLT